jgi:membrane protease YdiL (CAAX protease family)
LSETPEAVPPAPKAGEFFRAAWIFYLLLAIAGVVWLGLSRGTLDWAAFVGKAWPRDLLLGTAAAAVLVAAWRLGRRFSPAMRDLEAQIAGVIGPVETGEVLVLALLSGFAEELFFRGAMLGSWGPWISTALFGLMHSGRGWAFACWTLFALAAGGLFAALTVLTGNLLAAILAHVLVNAINLGRLANRPR